MVLMLCLAAMLARGDTLGAVMPVGDSITDGQGSFNGLGYRDDLAVLLAQHGVSFSYVGDVLGEGGNPDYPGHFLGGARIEEFYPPGFGNGWGTGSFTMGPSLSLYRPDVLLIHLGTNNVTSWEQPLGPYSLDGGASLYRSYAGYMAELIMYVVSQYGGAEGPLIVLCRIIPFEGMTDRVQLLNGYYQDMAMDMARGRVTGSPVHIVMCDQFTPFNDNPLLFSGLPGDYMTDSAHPNDLGYGVIASSYLFTLLDDTPPGTVDDLAVRSQGHSAARLGWTAPGDDWWCGNAAEVTLRIAGAPITDDDLFAGAWELVGSLAANPPGTAQQTSVAGLPSGRSFWVALRVADDRGNVSGVSNSPAVTLAPTDSLIEPFDSTPGPGVWHLGDYYVVHDGALRTAYPFPVWLPPAVMVGEQEPWEAGLRIADSAPGAETGRAGLVVLGSGQPEVCDGFVLLCAGGVLELRVLEHGVLGSVIDTALSGHGPLSSGSWLGAIPFVFDDTLRVRALRDGLPDRVLSTGVARQFVPSARISGVVMQGAMGWGIDAFRLGGPGLWEAPEPFHLVSPDSGAVVTVPPNLVWRASQDPDPWDEVRYTVVWSSWPDYPPGETTTIECGPDTTVTFSTDGFAQGPPVYWKVVATDMNGLIRESTETAWWFRPDTLAAEAVPMALKVGRPWPNPSSGTVTLRLSGALDQPLVLTLHDLGGRLVAASTWAGSGELRWAVPQAVPAGVYALTVGSGEFEARFRFVLGR